MTNQKLTALACLSFVFAAPVASAEDTPLTPPAYAEQAIGMLGRMISFKSVAGSDETYPLAQYISEELQKGGFDKSDIEIERVGDTATLVAYFRSGNDSSPILLSAHMDVVGADPADWTRDPFTMVREDGYLFGRGAIDNKFGIAMLVTTLTRLKQEGFKPSRDLILVLSGDEETDMATTMRLAERFKEAEMLLNGDAGGGKIAEDGSTIAYYVQGAEKTYADYTISFTNPGGHSSRPRADNAIYDLAAAAQKISMYQFPVQSSDITLESFRMAGSQTEGALGKAMRDFAENPNNKKAINVLSAHPETIGQIRTTCVATMLDAGHAPNALPQRASMNVNCRIFPGVAPTSVEQKLLEIVDNPAAQIELVDAVYYSDASPLRDDVMAALRKAIDRRNPELPIVPIMSAGATDSLHFRARGIDSYGVAGVFMKASDEFAHGLNERVPEAAVDGALDHWHTLLTTIADPDVSK